MNEDEIKALSERALEMLEYQKVLEETGLNYLESEVSQVSVEQYGADLHYLANNQLNNNSSGADIVEYAIVRSRVEGYEAEREQEQHNDKT